MAGIILGVFSLGMFVPWSNSTVSKKNSLFHFYFLYCLCHCLKGAGLGAILSFALMMMLGISTQIAKSNDLITNDQIKLLNADNCPPFNSTEIRSSNVHFLIQKYARFKLHEI